MSHSKDNKLFSQELLASGMVQTFRLEKQPHQPVIHSSDSSITTIGTPPSPQQSLPQPAPAPQISIPLAARPQHSSVLPPITAIFHMTPQQLAEKQEQILYEIAKNKKDTL